MLISSLFFFSFFEPEVIKFSLSVKASKLISSLALFRMNAVQVAKLY